MLRPSVHCAFVGRAAKAKSSGMEARAGGQPERWGLLSGRTTGFALRLYFKSQNFLLYFFFKHDFTSQRSGSTPAPTVTGVSKLEPERDREKDSTGPELKSLAFIKKSRLKPKSIK